MSNETIVDAINRTAQEHAVRDGQIMAILQQVLQAIEAQGKKDK